LGRKLIARVSLGYNAVFELVVRPVLAARCLPAGLLEIHSRQPVSNRNRQMAAEDHCRYRDHQPPKPTTGRRHAPSGGARALRISSMPKP